MNDDLIGSVDSRTSADAQPTVLIPTSRSTYRLVSYGTVIDFEDAMRERTDADLVDVPGYSRRARLRAALRPGDRTFARVPTPRDKYDLCFFVTMGPSWISSLHYIEGLREKCGRVVVYVFDAWLADADSLRRNRRLWSLCDLVYVSFPWAVDTYARQLDCPVEYLPQAARAARFHPFRRERPIDILSVGRRLADAHSLILEIARKHDFFYYYSEAMAQQAVDLGESQELLARLCQSARSQVCWPVEMTRHDRQQEGSPITARWFEAAACGSIVFGARPSASDFADIFPYDDFVFEFEYRRPVECERKLMSALTDEADWLARQELAQFIRGRHSWEARCDTILRDADKRVDSAPADASRATLITPADAS
jgi:hypothetical protein